MNNELWNKYGYCLNTLHAFEFNGEAGYKKMQAIMEVIRNQPLSIPNFLTSSFDETISSNLTSTLSKSLDLVLASG